MVNIYTHKPNIITFNRMGMRLGFLRSKILILLLVLVSWPGMNALSQVTVCDGSALTGSSIVSPSPGHDSGGLWSVTSTPAVNNIIFADVTVFNTTISGFESGYSYDFEWRSSPSNSSYTQTVIVSGTAPTVSFSSPDPTNLCAGAAIDLELTLSGVDGLFDVELTTDHPSGTITQPLASSVAGVTHTRSYTLNADASFEITSVVDNLGTGCDVAPGDLPGPISFNVLPNASSQTVTGSSVCAPGSIGDIELQSSEAGVEYRLMYDDGINPPSTAQTLTSATDGQAYTFIPAVTAVGSYTVQATTGCAGGVAVVVDMIGGPFAISNAPTVYAISTPSPACVGSSLTLSGLEADVVYFLLRNNVRTGAFIDGSSGAIVFGGLSAGDYTVEAERNGCVQPMSGTLRVQATPQQFTLSTNKNSYCSGVANTGVELSLSGSQSGIKYQLQRNTGGGFLDYGTAVDGTNSALLSAWQNIPDGTYRVVARTSAGCTNNMTGRPVIIETIPPSAGISTSNPNSRCVGSTVDFFINVTLSGAQPFSFDIINNIGEPVISVSNYYSDTYSRQVNPASNATYTLTNLIDASSCEPELNIGQVQFFVRPLPVFNFSSAPNPIGLVGGVPSTSICSGSPVTLEMQVSNTSGPYQYSWSHGLGNSVNVTFTPNATRTYDATVRNEYGCQDTKPVEVVVNPLPVIDFNLATGTNEVCENEGTVALIPVAPNTGGAFSGPGVTGSFFDPATAGASLIPHNISYTFQNTTTGCASTITKPVIVHPEPNVSVLGNQTNFCADQLTGTLSGNPQNSNGIWVLAAGARPWFSDNGNGRANINITGALADAGESSYTADYIYTDPTTGCVSDGNYLTFNVRDDLSNNVDFRLSGGGAIPATLCQDDSDIDLEAFFVNNGVVIADGTFSGPGISDNGDGTAIFSADDAGTGMHVINYNYTDPATQCNGNASHSIQIGTLLTLNGLNSIYCKEDAAFQIYGDPGPGTLEIFFESEVIARFTQLNNSSTNQFTITPSAVAWEAGDYTAVFTYSDGCDNVIEYDFTISDALDATFTVKDNQVQFCVTQDANPYNYVVELIPSQNGGTFTINTPSGDGVEPNGTSFYPDVAQPDNYIITYTIQTGACSATYSLPVVVVGNPLVSISNLSDSYCENSPDFVISASNLPVVAGASYTFSATANAAGRVPIYEITKGDLNTLKEIDDTNVNFSPSYVGPGTYFITYTFDNTTNAGCISTFVKEVEILEAPGVDFGVTDPVSGATITTLEFCQSASPLVLAGDIFTDPGNPLSSGTGFFTGVGIDNLIDGVGSGTNGRAGFDPSLVTPSDAHSITYSYTNYNGCQTQRTRDFKILAAPIDHYKVVSDPASGIYCFEAPPVDPTTYGVQIGLEFTQVDVTYHLLLDGVATGQTLVGRADGAGDVFTNRVTDEGTYTVRAELDAVPPTSACVAIMSGSVEVRRNYVTGTIDELIHESCAGVADGFIKMSAGGGTSPYVFTLNTGTVSASGEFSGLAPGTYTVTIEDAVGCIWTSGNIVINPGNVIAISASAQKNVVCFGESNGTFTVTATGLPSGNYEFLLSGSATWVSNGTGKYIFNNLPAGTYDVTVRDANSAGCQTVMAPAVVIAQPTAAVSMANFDLTPVVCSLANTGSIEVEAAGGDQANGFNYVLYREVSTGFWVNIAASAAPVAFSTAHTFPSLFAGNYRVVASDTKGCSVTAVYTVDGPTSLPSIILSGDEIVHVSQSGLLDGAIEVAISGGKEPYNIVWTEIDALGGATVGVPLTPGLYRQDNLAAGFYRITVTDDNGCEDVLEVEVLDDAVSAFDLTFTTVNPGPCNGSSNGRINLRAVGGITPYLSLTLTNGAGQVMTAATAGNSFASYENLQAGNYTATVVDTRGVSLSEVIILTQPAAPVVISHAVADATCFGENGNLTFSATGGTLFDNGTGADTTDDYYNYTILPSSGIAISGKIKDGETIDVQANLPLTDQLPAGDYLLTIRDAVTCFDVVNFTISEPDAMSIVVEDRQHNLCNGASNGSITVSVSGRPGGTAFTFDWERYDVLSSTWVAHSSGPSASINSLAAGNYRVQATETASSSCPSDFSGAITIGEPAVALAVVAIPTNITTCQGDATGSVRLSVTGGTAPYTIAYGTVSISWNGLNDYVVTDLLVGTYDFTITDSEGCFVEESATIAEPTTPFVASVADSGITCETLNSGWIDLSMSGGVDSNGALAGGFRYAVQVIRQENNQIFHNQTHDDPVAGVIEIDNLPAGTYTIRVWDGNSTAPDRCGKTFEVELRNMVVNANVKHPNCTGLDNGSIEAIVTGGSGNFSYAWERNGTPLLETSNVLANLQPETYKLTITDIDNGSCTVTRTYIIYYDYTLAVTTNVTDVSCFGGSNGSAIASPSGGTAPYFYLWERQNGASWSTLTNTATLSNRAAGTYRVTVTDANNCEVVSADVDIDQPVDFDIASISYTRVTVSCYGGADGSFTVNTNRVGNFEYSIDAVNWQILPTFDNLAAGSYRISIRDMDQPAPYCAKYEVETATINEANPIVISLATQVNVNCFGDATGLLKVVVSGGTVATDYDYQWYKVTSTGNIPQAGKTAAEASSLSEGSYFVMVLDDYGCSATSDVYTITEPASAPLVSVISNQSVSALNGNDGSITVAISGGTPGYSIAWSGVDYEGNAVVLTQNVVTLNNLKAGIYMATVTDDKGCTDDITITVSQPGDALTLDEESVNPQPCNGATNGSVELTAAGGALPYTFTLIRNPGTEITAFSVSGNKAFYNGLAAGFYTARVRDNNGNVVELPDLELTQPLPVEIYDITPANITCFGENDGSIKFSIRGGTPHATNGYSYILRPENGTDIIDNGTINILEEDLKPDNYTLMVFDASNVCFAEHSFTLTQPDDIVITETITPVSCNGLSDGSIRIEVSGGIGGAYTYQWFEYNTGTTSWDAIASSNTAWLQSRAAGRYKVEVTELGGSTCSKESVDFELSQPDVLSASATAVGVTTCMGDNSGSIKVEVSGGVGPYLVDYGIGTQNGAGPEFFIEGLVADDYILVVTDNNGSGCQTVATATVGEPDEALSVTTPVVTYSCTALPLPSTETHSVSFNINGGVGINNGTDDEFSYDIEVVNLVTSGRKTKKIALTIDQPVVVNLDDLNLITGNYLLIVTDAQGAVSSNCAAVEHVFTISRMAVSQIVSPVSCPGAADGAIDISVTGGSGNYAYAWVKDGLAITETSQDLSGLSDGNYTLTLTDVSEPDRCPITRTYTVSNAKTLVVESSIEPVKCFGGNNGAIRISGVANAAPGLSYYWNGSAVAGTNELTGLAAGNYSVEIIDADGCRVTLEEEITEPDMLFFDLKNDLTCAPFNQRIYVDNLSGGNGDVANFSYEWTDPDGNLLPYNTKEIDVTKKGTYKVTVTDELGICSLPRSIYVSGIINISTLEVQQIKCNGGTGLIKIKASGGHFDNQFTYNWQQETTPGTWEDVDALATNPLVNGNPELQNAPAAVYRVVVRNVSDGCESTSPEYDLLTTQASLIEYDSVTPTNITRCYGDLTGEIAIRVKGGSGTYFLDYNEDGVNDYTSFDGYFDVTGLAAGSYQLRVTDANGCNTNPALSLPIPITQPAPLTLVVDEATTKIDCSSPNTGVIEFAVTGGNKDASGNPSYKISVSSQLDRDVVLEGLQSYSNLPAGTYIIQVQDMLASDPAACTFVYETVVLEHIQITGTPIPNACAVTTNNIGAIRNIQITGTSDIPTWQGYAAPSNSVWYWDETGGALGGDPVTDNTQLNQENLPVGEYVLVVIDNGRGGCEVRKTFIVSAQSTLEIKGNAVPISCYGAGDGLISGIEVTGTFNYSYNWTGSGVDNSLILKDGQKNLEAGTYVLSVTDSDNGCQVSKSFVITEPGEITYDLVEEVESCSPYRRGIKLENLTGGTGTYNFRWTGPDAANRTTQDLAGLKKGGLYNVDVSYSSCKVSKSISIADTVKIKTDVTQLDCFGDANGVIAVPEITGGSGNFSYAWTKDGAPYKSGADISDINISGLSAGVYELTLTDNGTSDAGGACEYVVPVTLTQPDLIVATGDIKHITCNGAQNGAINISVSGGTAPYTYIWTTIDGVGLNKFSQNQIGVSGGTYTVQVKDAKGCVSAETQFIVNEVGPIDFDLIRTKDTDCDGTNGELEINNFSGGSNKYKYLWSTTDGSGIAQNSPTQIVTGGTYTVKVWDEDYPACFLEKQATLTKAITIAPTVTNQTCNSNANGSIDIAVTGGVAPYTYEWTPAVGITNINQASQSNLTEGTYALKVTDSRPVADGGPCVSSVSVPVGLDYDIQADVNVNHVSCKGGNNGSISLTKVTGAMAGNYAFVWSGLPVGKVATDKNQSGLPAGSYTVKITDKNSDCFINKTIVIIEPDDAVTITSINVTDIDCKGDASGTIEVVAEGGTPFSDGSNNYYKYAWVGPGIGLVQDSPSQSNLAAGTYTVTVTDSLGGTGGCEAFSGNIVVTEPDAAIAATVINVQDVSAQGGSDGAIQISTSGGSGSMHYAWSGMAFDGFTVIPVTHIGSNPAGLVAGKYSVDITDDKFCSFTLENIIVEEPGLPLTMEVTTKNIQPCNGNANGEIHIDAFGGTSPYTITLLQGATIINEVVANQMNEVGLSQGVYVVAIKDANNVVITKNDVEILEPAPLQLSASVSPNVSCTGNATGSLSYTISGGSASYSVLVTGPGSYKNEAKDIVAGTYPLTGLAAGTYRILMIDNNSGNGAYLLHENCYKETTVTITEPKALVTISDNSTICKGESTNIRLSVSDYTGVYPLTIKLSDGSTKTLASANETFVVNPVEDTEYTITQVLDNAGTCIQGSGTGSALVTVNDIPSAHIELIGDDEVCLGEEISFSIHFEGEGPFNVRYSNGTVQTNLNNVFAKDTLIKVVPLESITYQIAAMSDANCTGTFTGAAVVVVNELPSVTMDIAPDDAVICKGSSSEIQFSFPSGTEDYRVSFTENGVLRSINATPLVAGSYFMAVSPKITTAYKLISVRDANNCEVAVNEVTQTITVNESPKSAGDIIGKTLVCQGEQLVTYKIDSIGFADSYVWEVPASMGTIASQTDTIIIINFKDDFVSGSISVKGKNDCGEGVAFVLPITTKKLPLKPDAPSGTISMCAGSTGLTYSIPAVDYAIKYEWLLPIGFKYANGDSTGNSIMVDVKEGYTDFVGDISVIAINNCGTSEVSDALTVRVNPFPVAVADKGNFSNRACASTYTLNAVDPDPGYTGVWTSNRNIGTGLVTTGQENNPTASIYNLSQGANAFIWTVTNDLTGCSTSDEVTIYNDQVTVFAVADQYTVCDGIVNLSATPLTSVDAPGGTGVWSTPDGGILTPANDANTQVTHMARGENTFIWTIQKGACSSSATVKVNNNQPTEAIIYNAADVIIAQQDLPCGTTSTNIKGSEPKLGETGYWRIETGSVSIDNMNSHDIQITNIPTGDHILSWNILNGSCVSTATVKIRNNSFMVDAGMDNFTCDGSIALSATPLLGGATGQWTTAVGTFDDATKASTTVSNLTQTGNGINVLRWTVRRNGCESFDEVIITNNQPTKAQIQGDKVEEDVCDSVFVLNAIDPLYGTGIWSVVSGEGSFEDNTVHNTKVRGFINGKNIYRWTVYNQTCSSSAEFAVNNLHVDVYAGVDTAVCATMARLHATPAIGTWSVVDGMGSGSFRPTTLYPVGRENPNASVESLSSGNNQLVWQVTNKGCISTDTVVISNNSPTPVEVDPIASTTESSILLYAKVPNAGNGLWTLLEGRGTIISPTSPTTRIDNLFPNINRFRWTVTNLNCSEYVDVEVRSGAMADANAGLDQLDLCEDFTTLQANLPPNVFGQWTIESGGVQFENDDHNKAKVKIYNILPGRNVLKWTLSSGSRSTSDTVVIINNKPSDAQAGYDITECASTTQLNAREPSIGTPLWTILSGGGTFSDDTIAKPTVTNLAPGTNILKYQIQNEICFSYDTLQVFNMEPSEAYAGEDHVVCVDSAEIRPTIPKYGEGTWRVVKGAGKGKNSKGEFTDRIQGNYVYSLAPGENILVWEVQVPGAAAECIKRDSITIVNNEPSVSYAGQDRSSKCMDEVTLSGSALTNGSKGTWTLISGSGEIADSSLTNTLVTKLGLGKNRFRWTVDKNGCTSISEVEISNNLIVAIAGDPQINCVDTATLQANNPSPGIGSWGVKGGSGSAKFGDNTDPYTIVRNLDKGENILTWTIQNKECPSVSEVKIINNAPSTADAGDNKATCENTFVLGASDPEVGKGIWTIRSGGGKFANDLDESTMVDSLKFGDNLFRWTVEHEGCYSSDDVQISFNEIEAKVAGDQDICSDRVFLEANSAVPGLGTWTIIGGGSQAKFVDSHDPVTEAFDLAKGKNRLKWTINHKGCITSKEVVITNHMPATAYAGNTQEFCREETILDATPIASGLGTGEWTILTGSAIIAASEINDPKAHITGLSKGENVLRWTVTSDNGLCDSKDDVRIINNLPSIPYAGASDEYCSSTVVLKAAAPDFGTGRWSIEEGGGDLNDPALPNATITNLNEGKNILRWTVSQGQCLLFSDIEVINSTPSKANAGPDIDDCKDYATLDANMPTPGNGNGSWTLTSGNADFKDELNPKTLVSNLTFGKNILRWNIQKGKCISSDEIIVNNNIPDQAKAGTDRETCEDYLTLNANDPTTGIGTWHVLSGNGDFDDLHSPISIVRNLKLGENIFKWVVSYGSCTTEDEVEINSNKAAPYAGEDDVSYLPFYELKASNPGELGAMWSLVAGDGSFEDETFYNTRVNGLREGINTFRWLMDINGCITFDDVSIEYKLVPDASFKVDTFQGCYPLRVQFTNQSIGGSTYSWDFGDERYSSERNPVHIFREPGEFTVTLTAPGPDNVDGTYQRKIWVHEHPTADFTYGPDVLYVPGDVLRAYSNSVDADKYLWDFGDGNTSTQVNPAYKYKDVGIYTLKLQVTSVNNCVDEMVKVNAVEVKAEGFVVFPNSFMPRPDGGTSSTVGGGETNSIFRPVYKDVETYKLQIFNRWGQLIYEGQDIDQGWNGFFNGQLSPQAVYVYKAMGTFISGREFNESGSVLLVR